MALIDELKERAAPEWHAYTHHRFTQAIGEGTLPEAAFRHYLVQDYLFLIEFARAYALAVYKAPRLDDMRAAADAVAAILNTEMSLHVRLSERWGLTASDLEAAEPAPEMLAYTRYVLETGLRGDLLALQVAVAPCGIGYAEIGARLARLPRGRDRSNPYAGWIAEYAGEAFQEGAAKSKVMIDRLAAHYATPARVAELEAIFREATRLETRFWDMGWRAGE